MGKIPDGREPIPDDWFKEWPNKPVKEDKCSL